VRDAPADERQAGAPQQAAEDVEAQEERPRHPPDARGDRHERAHDADEAGDDDRGRAVAQEEAVRALDRAMREEAG
jgi:hypothetical protein